LLKHLRISICGHQYLWQGACKVTSCISSLWYLG
jgi:hypothetical protein